MTDHAQEYILPLHTEKIEWSIGWVKQTRPKFQEATLITEVVQEIFKAIIISTFHFINYIGN